MKKKSPTISKEAAEEFTANTAALINIGYKTILWADQVGIPQAMGFDSLRDWVTEKLGGYIRYPAEERQKIVQELSTNGEPIRTIADVLGVAPTTVYFDLKGDTAHRGKKFSNETKTPAPEPENVSNETKHEEDGPSDTMIRWTEEKGLHTIIWGKIQSVFIPAWLQMLDLVDEDEKEHLLDAIEEHIHTIQNQNETT